MGEFNPLASIKFFGKLINFSVLLIFVNSDGETELTNLTIGKEVTVKIDLGEDLDDPLFLTITTCRHFIVKWKFR